MAGLIASCIFCKIIRGELPSLKVLETEKSFAFLDIGPLSRGHSLIVPKRKSAKSVPTYHGEKLTDIPDDYLADILPIAKKIAIASGSPDYNILQNNGWNAHQDVMHVHFHVIPKPSDADDDGLVIGWPAKKTVKEELQVVLDEMKVKL